MYTVACWSKREESTSPTPHDIVIVLLAQIDAKHCQKICNQYACPPVRHFDNIPKSNHNIAWSILMLQLTIAVLCDQAHEHTR